MNLQKQLGKRIQELRKQRGLSQEQLAEKIDIANNTMSNIERGNSFMTAPTLERIMDVLCVSPRELFTFTDENDADDVYRYILLKIKFAKNDISKLSTVKAFLDAIM